MAISIAKPFWFNKEKELQAYITKLFQEDIYMGNCVYRKLPDTGYDLKPYDFLASTAKGDFHCEAKCLLNMKHDIMWKMKPQQRANLRALSKLWRQARIIVYYKQEDCIIAYTFNQVDSWDTQGIAFEKFITSHLGLKVSCSS